MTAMVLAFFSVLAGPQQQGADEFAKLVAAVEGFYAKSQDFSAQFEQTVVRVNLPDRPVVKKGKVYFKRPGMMRWDYLEPDEVYYVSDGEVLWNYIPESKLAYRMKVKDSELFYALRFLYGEGSLAKDFDLSDGGREGELAVIVVKPKQAEQNFQELRLLVDVKTSQIAETVLTDPAGNVSRIKFVKVSFQELPKDGFSYTPGPDIQVEDLSK